MAPLSLTPWARHWAASWRCRSKWQGPRQGQSGEARGGERRLPFAAPPPPLCPSADLRSAWPSGPASRKSGYGNVRRGVHATTQSPGLRWKGRDLRGGPGSGWIGGWRRPPKRLGGGYCRLRMPLRLALAVRGTSAGHGLGALEGGPGGGVPPPPLQCISLPLPPTASATETRLGETGPHAVEQTQGNALPRGPGRPGTWAPGHCGRAASDTDCGEGRVKARAAGGGSTPDLFEAPLLRRPKARGVRAVRERAAVRGAGG